MSERQMQEHLFLLTPAEAGESVAWAPAPAAARADGAGERAHEPRVDGNALAGGGGFDRHLQSLGKPQGDAGDQGILRSRRRGRLALVLDVKERRILAGHPDLD